MNVRLAKLARKFLYHTKNILANEHEEDTAPYLRLAIDFMPDNDPLRERGMSLIQRLETYIFSPGYERQLIVCNLPEDMEDYEIPPPIYTYN